MVNGKSTGSKRIGSVGFSLKSTWERERQTRTTIKYDLLDPGLLAQSVQALACGVEAVGGQVDGRADSSTGAVCPSAIDKQELLQLWFGIKILLLEKFQDGLRLDMGGRRGWLWECCPPWCAVLAPGHAQAVFVNVYSHVEAVVKSVSCCMISDSVGQV